LTWCGIEPPSLFGGNAEEERCKKQIHIKRNESNKMAAPPKKGAWNFHQ